MTGCSGDEMAHPKRFSFPLAVSSEAPSLVVSHFIAITDLKLRHGYARDLLFPPSVACCRPSPAA